jgi:hypothetical protein
MRRLSGLANTLSHMDTHRLQLSCAAEDMEDYISHLERKFYDLVCDPRDQRSVMWESGSVAGPAVAMSAQWHSDFATLPSFPLTPLGN